MKLLIKMRDGNNTTVDDPEYTVKQFNATIKSHYEQGFISLLTTNKNIIIPWDNISHIVIDEDLAP